jgi:hypothetical protein
MRRVLTSELEEVGAAGVTVDPALGGRPSRRTLL